MFLVEMDVRLGSIGAPLADDEITDLIERVVDKLDQLAVDPSVGTRRVDGDVDMTIGVTIDEDDQFEALRRGAAVIATGLQLCGIGAGQLVAHDTGLTSSARVLQAV